ncbi:relaxase/mobilization nuclease domain-containing protein [Paludicola sp. MB14-C6]|uniref:relaxase/mobilization nuclease domain-containing protein n=1 Tax=Paludihabitans sp. MB14-C6 TaxID=3070656 RepID=UPI0027DB2379|nr:relaxase/mobilization nuclease domain-containing protein [Paludicola sp. MB14-C6]WMJ22890.1 relaxase/mobilization nuclease domain-containing protein [Paludicola sp. MB14-C6]
MAITKIKPVHNRLDKLVDYVSNQDKTYNTDFEDIKTVLDYASEESKTEQKFYVSGVNCNPQTAYKEMKLAHKKNVKEAIVVAYHGFQSFEQGEVNAETAHEIGIKLANELWEDKFQVVVATHLNTNHYHNHFVVCATSYIDGSRFHACTQSYMQMRETSDRLCKEYSLSVIEHPKRGYTKSYAEYMNEKQDKPTVRSFIRSDIDYAIEQSTNTNQFWQTVESMGYEIKNEVKYLAIRPVNHQRFFRLYKLGENYTIEAIKDRILRNRNRKLPFPQEQSKPVKYLKFNGSHKAMKKVSGLRALYYYYCYKLKIIQKHPSSNRRMHFLLRDDLIKFNQIIAHCTFLSRTKIDTTEGLSMYKSTVEAYIPNLLDERKLLRSQLKRLVRSNDTVGQVAVKGKIQEISTELSKIRREVKLCNQIEERSTQMRSNLELARTAVEMGEWKNLSKQKNQSR